MAQKGTGRDSAPFKPAVKHQASSRGAAGPPRFCSTGAPAGQPELCVGLRNAPEQSCAARGLPLGLLLCSSPSCRCFHLRGGDTRTERPASGSAGLEAGAPSPTELMRLERKLGKPCVSGAFLH